MAFTWFPDSVANILRTFPGFGVRLYGSTSGSVGLVPPANAGATDYTLPASLPASAGLPLTSDLSGVLSWSAIKESQVTGLVSDLAGKQATGNYVTALTGDVTASGPGSVAATVTKINGVVLGTTTATAGNLLIGSGTQWVTKAVSGDGTLSSTGALTVTKTSGVSFGSLATQNGTFSGASSGTNTGDQTITLTGDVTGSGTGSFAATVAKIAGVAVGTPTGSGNIVFSASPTITGTLTAATITASGVISTNVSGAASASVIMLTGAIQSGGTGTTNVPHVFIQPSTAAAFTSWSINGTALGMNLPSGYTGNLIDCRVNTTSGQFTVSAGGTIISTGRFTTSTPVAASLPAIGLTGPLFTGGTGTTNWPQYLPQTASATAVTTWSTAGTYFGVNANSGFSGNFFDFRINGGSTLLGQLTSSGALTLGSTITTASPTGGSSSAAAWQLGNLVTATSTLDTTKYLEVNVGGTIRKLCLAS